MKMKSLHSSCNQLVGIEGHVPKLLLMLQMPRRFDHLEGHSKVVNTAT